MKLALALSLLLLASRAQASVPDPLEPPSVVTVVLAKGDTLLARSVEPRPFGMFRVTDLTDAARNLPANRILRVIDSAGEDRTRDALERRKTIGSPPTVVEVRRRKPHRDARTARSYGVNDFSLLLRTGHHFDTRTERTNALMFDLGRAWNVGDRLSVGASIFGMAAFGTAAGSEYADLGVRPRVRRWLGKRSSVEVAPGIIVAHMEPEGWRPRGAGFVGQVALNHSEWLGLVVQGYAVRRSRDGSGYWSNLRSEGIDRDSGVMVGVRFGRAPGLVGGVATALLGLASYGVRHAGTY